MIQIYKLNKKYKNKVIFNNVTMNFKDHGIYSITGESGVGKTTLMNLLSGIDQNYDGDIFLNNNKITSNTLNIRRSIVSCVFQNYGLINEMSVKQNLELVIERENNNTINSVLSSVNMLAFAKVKVCDLSGGQAQRVAIARCILKKSKIIIADEPTGNLDKKNSLDIFDLLKELSKDKLVLIITHDLNISEKCDGSYNLKGNKIYQLSE